MKKKQQIARTDGRVAVTLAAAAADGDAKAALVGSALRRDASGRIGQRLRQMFVPATTALSTPLARRCTSARCRARFARQTPRVRALRASSSPSPQPPPQQPPSPPSSSSAWLSTRPTISVEQFFADSVGSWRSQRSSHGLALSHFEQIVSDIVITRASLTGDDAQVNELCERHGVERRHACMAVRVAWRGTSDWDEGEHVLEGESVLVVLKGRRQRQQLRREEAGDDEATTTTTTATNDNDSRNDGDDDVELDGWHGTLLRSSGYAEQMPHAAGEWSLVGDTFVLHTPYERASAEERIWFAAPNVRMRVSMIRTQGGAGVINAGFSTEVRRLRRSGDGGVGRGAVENERGSS